MMQLQIKSDIMQGPLQQQRGSKDKEKGIYRQNSQILRSNSTKNYSGAQSKSTQPSRKSQKSSLIEQQILQINCQKFDLTNQQALITFLNRIIHLASQALKYNRSKYLTEAVNLFLTKMTKLNYKSSYTYEQKIQQINKWKPLVFSETSKQHCDHIISYIIELVDQQNFQEMMLVFYFAFHYEMVLQDTTLSAVSSGIHAFILENDYENTLITEICKLVIGKIEKLQIYYSVYLLKAYANCMTYLLKFIKSKENLQIVQQYFQNFCFLEAIINYNKKTQIATQVLSSQLQNLFIALCEAYVLIGYQKILRFIVLFLSSGTTQTMVKNVWNLLNADHNIAVFTKQNLSRLKQLLKLIKQKNSGEISYLNMKPKESWMLKIAEKNISVIVAQLILTSPRKKNRNDKFIMTIQMEMGSIVICVRPWINENTKSVGFSLILHKKIRRQRQSIQQKQQIQLIQKIQSCKLNLGIEYTGNKRLNFWQGHKKITDVSIPTFGKPKSVTIGVRKQDNENENAIEKIQALLILEDATYQQYIKQFQYMKSNSTGQKSLKQLKLKKRNSLNIPNEKNKFDFLEQMQKRKQRQKTLNSQKLNPNSKYFTTNGVQLCHNSNYTKLVQKFQGKKKIPTYLLSALQKIKDDQIIQKYISVVQLELNKFQIEENNFYEIYFVHGFSLFQKRSLPIIMSLIQIVSPSNIKIETGKCRNQYYQTQKIYKLRLLLKSLISLSQSQGEAIKIFWTTTIDEYCDYSIRLQKQDMKTSFKRLLSFLNTVQWGYINDYSTNFLIKDSLIIPQDIQNKQSNQSFQMTSLKQNKDICIIFKNSIEQSIQQIFIKSKYEPFLILLSLKQYLQLSLILLSNISLAHEIKFKKYQIFYELLHICTVLEIISFEIARIKDLNEIDANKICALLSQVYNLLPVLTVYCCSQLKINQINKNKQEYFYELYSTQVHGLRLKDSEFYTLIRKFYAVFFKIGSFCLKEKKNGFLTYMSHAYLFMSNQKDNFNWDENFNSLTIKDRILISQIYLSCWKFILIKQDYYKLDNETSSLAIEKLAQLCLPLYFDDDKDKKSILQRIIQDYTFYEYKVQFPIHLLSNIQAEQLQKILLIIIQNLNKLKKQERVNSLMYILSIANSYSIYIQLDIDLSLYQTEVSQKKYKELYNQYKWFQAYSQVKRIYVLLQEKKQDQIISNGKNGFHTQIESNLKAKFTQIKTKIDGCQNCQNLKYLLNNFINSDHSNENFYESQSREYFLPFLDTVLNQFREINNSNFKQKYPKKKKKDNQILNCSARDNIKYFLTQREQINQSQSTKIQNISKLVAQRIIRNNEQYFAEIYLHLAKDKNNALISYYKMIQNLSFEQKMYKPTSSHQYSHYEYYILDDYLNSKKTKTMLKKDFVSIIGNLITKQIPRLFPQKQTSGHSVYALLITKNLQDLNSNPFFQVAFQNDIKSTQTVKAKGIESIPAFLITKSKIYQGKIQIDQKYVQFLENTIIDKKVYKKLYTYESEQRTYQQISASRRIVTIQIKSIVIAEKKKYLQSYPSLQIHEKNVSYFFVFQKEEYRKKFLDLKIKSIEKFQKAEQINEIKSKWQKGWITNFQLLIAVNSISGRSFNDVSQYYVFPWTICNFKTSIDKDKDFLKKKQNFRDLSLPIGAQNSQKIQTIVNKYKNSLIEPGVKEKPYMYGSFYSNPGVVCNYLLRVNPFTIHHYQLQGNRFDLYDRLFTNMDDQYESIQNTILDNRELVPEFYCAPEFFRNRNRYNFAHTKPQQNKIDLKMRFPNWVITQSPEQFVLRMRSILESEIVSAGLGSWIDLIFGFKSEIQVAEKYKNLYMPQLYIQKQNKTNPINQYNLRQSQIDHKAHMIKLFGQVPQNIFGKKPSIKSEHQVVADSIYHPDVKQSKIQIFSQEIQNSQICFDFKNNILAVGCLNQLAVINTKEQIQKLQINVEENIKSLSIMPLSKQKSFIVFAILQSGKLYMYPIKIGKIVTLIITRGEEYVREKSIHLCQQSIFNEVKSIGSYLIAVQQASIKMFKIDSRKIGESQKIFNNLQYYIEDKGYLSIHRAPITNIQIYQNLSLAISIDSNGLVNSWSLEPQLTIRATFNLRILKANQKITKLLIHEMGIILLLTDFGQILLYNIYGDLILRVRLRQKKISDIVFWDDCASSEVLLSTKKGQIYQFDIFDLVKDIDYLAGVQVSIGDLPEYKQAAKQGYKIITNRFGRYWQVFLLSSLNEATIIQCKKQFNKIFTAKKLLQNINNNSHHRNI